MFISVAIPLANEKRVRPYTIANSPEDGEPFELCFNLVSSGPGAAWMFERQIGDLLDFTGPYGAFTLEHAPDRELVFIAEATAIAPIRPMLRRVLTGPTVRSVHLLYAAPRVEHLLYRSELESLSQAYPRFKLDLRVLAHDRLYQSLLDEVQLRWVANDNDRTRQFFLCGIGPGVLKLRDLLRQSGYERRAVRYEQW
jgi:ferredoxin-NADP reductase